MTIARQKIGFPSPIHRRILRVSVYVLLVPVFIAAVLFLLDAWFRHLASDPKWYKPATAEELRLTEEKTKRLRDYWRVWAKAHQPELRRMLSGDRVAMLTAYDALPVEMSTKQINRYEGVDFGPTDVHAGKLKYLWYAGAAKIEESYARRQRQKGLIPHAGDDPRLQKSIPQSIRNETAMRNDCFASHHDFPVLGSDTNGPVKYFLWASGRVTKATETEESRRNFTFEHKDIVPPYDFLPR